MSDVDLIVKDALVVDGSGDSPFHGDVAVDGAHIAAVGDLDGRAAREVIDVNGRLAVAPGFIDVHTHDDRLVLVDPEMTPKVSQGVTSVVVGNCGISLSPVNLDKPPPPPMNLLGGREDFAFPTFAAYAQALEAAPPATNVAALVGHSALRAEAMDSLDRAASADEVSQMGQRLDAALAAGAIGLSSGLDYPPANAAPTQEVIDLCRSVARAGGLYTTHMRDEGDHIVAALEETFQTGREAGVPVVISHKKCSGHRNWGRSRETLALIEEAQGTQELNLDCYPYAASSTVLLPKYLDKAEKVMVTWSETHPESAGRELADIARDWGCDQLEAAERLSPAGAIYFQMDEGDLQRIMAYPGTMIGSDGLPHDPHPHPRLWGTFPRVLGRYCRELGLFSLAEAVHRMTGKPAAVFGLKDRGRIKAGACADLVLFDPETVIDRADFKQPRQTAAGIEAVFVNGQMVWRHGQPTGARPGQLLRRHTN